MATHNELGKVGDPCGKAIPEGGYTIICKTGGMLITKLILLPRKVKSCIL